MLAVIIVTHHTLAEHLIATAGFIVGNHPCLVGISISQQDDVEAARNKLLDTITGFHKQGRQVLILTDMFGGTPSNLSLALYEPGKVEIVSGVNLPMLLKVFSRLDQEGVKLHDVASELTEYGRKNIFTAAEFLDL
jgi:PTS system mannose-specific IIA component